MINDAVYNSSLLYIKYIKCVPVIMHNCQNRHVAVKYARLFVYIASSVQFN